MKDSMLYTLLMHGWLAVAAVNLQAVFVPLVAAAACFTLSALNYLSDR